MALTIDTEQTMNTRIAVAILMGSLVQGAAFAQGSAATFPSRAVTVILPFAPGGPTEPEARLEIRKAGDLLGQPFVLDFKPGAATSIGAHHVIKSKPDGHTLLVTAASLTVFPAFYTDLPFDITKDLAYVSLMSKRPTALLVTPSFPARSFKEYIAYVRANPGKVNMGTSGSGGVGHLAGAWIHTETKTLDMVTFVHFKGTGPVFPELIAGRIHVHPTSLAPALPLIRSGKLRAIAIMSDDRTKLLPDVPTLQEQGLPPGVGYTTWQGFAAPSGTPAEIIGKLSQTFAQVAKSPEVSGPLEKDGSVMVGSTPEEFRQLIVREVNAWRKVVKETGIKVE
jgi:tripartite-type tricarboxylate transporter receptor subunit TctC